MAGPAPRALIHRLLAQWGLPSSSLSQQNEKCFCQPSQGGVSKTTAAYCNRERPATGKKPCVTCQEQGSPTLDAESPGGSFTTTVWAPPPVSQVSGMKNYSGQL